MRRKSLRSTLAKNLSALMAADSSLDTCLKLSARSGVGNGTVDRIRRGEASATLDTLESLAAAFRLQPWQLLVEDFDHKKPPKLRGQSEQEQKFYSFIESLTTPK